jgi:hypothetical protein
MGEKFVLCKIMMLLWQELLFKWETYYKTVYAVIVRESCGTLVILVCGAGNLVIRDAITGFGCICFKNKTMLYFVVIENKSFTFIFV